MMVLCKPKTGARKCESAKLQYKSCSVRFDAVRCGSIRVNMVVRGPDGAVRVPRRGAVPPPRDPASRPSSISRPNLRLTIPNILCFSCVKHRH